MAHPLDWLESNAERRRSEGLRRSLRPRTLPTDAIDLAGNDYLGLSQDARVVEGAVRALRAWGAGSTGSRLVTGTTALHATLEEELAAFCGAEAALVFSSGYTANLGVVTALSGRGALVVSDAHSHASLVDACRLSRARVVVTPRSDVAAVDAALAARTEPRALVVTDGVDSIDGGVAPLRELHAVCRARGAVLVVDEAHALGVCGPGGRGVLREAGLAGADDVVATVTLSKSLGGQGGAVLGPRAVVEHLVDTARTFIFDTGLAPACVGAALAALRVLREEPDRPAAVLQVAQELAAIARSGLASAQGRSVPEKGTPPAGPLPFTGSAVVPVVLGSPVTAFRAAGRCLDRGVRAGCFRPPSVPEGTSRLRLTARADLTTAELDRVRVVLHEVLAEVRR
ncbi:8-amino-7-oxononanoate synthase [Pseudonocardia kujensis]|uniref:8-amino-7-oxononanoate synthase n=1 Tax=Pseudonocardia kujensis TaxID=1128675 RepID=UPI001E516F62|nr:8-amino-7-oxononanoate synthase [Pseudonocardia kujensis]MCE0767571.1 8-amino-7-oxononanoate synthase [Pseudonocardia kujensis]